MTRRLSRSADGRPAAPVRIVHLGLGNFFRAHEAWYTENAPDADAWGIAAFSGRSLGVAEQMREQDGLYTLVVHAAGGNEYQVISSIVATHPGPDVAVLLDYFRSPEVAIVTSTITEAGYLRDESGGLAAQLPAVQADIAAIQAGDLASVTTAPGKFVAGLVARREAGAGPITFVPCDNIGENGPMLERVLRDFAALADPTLLGWIDDFVGFVTTMVDRITPRATEATFAAVEADCGVDDPAAVGTEPFSQWVLSGDFVAGRPAWEAAGAQFVDDIAPYETLKLWMLNGSHSLMAYTGPVLGRPTVFEAMSDPTIAGWVNEWWDVAAKHLPLPADEVASYRVSLTERFLNPNMVDHLSRIAADGSLKIPIRIVTALNAEVAAGNRPTGAERAVAAWTLHLRGLGAPLADARADQVAGFGTGTLAESVAKVCDYLGIADEGARADIVALAVEIEAKAV